MDRALAPAHRTILGLAAQQQYRRFHSVPRRGHGLRPRLRRARPAVETRMRAREGAQPRSPTKARRWRRMCAFFTGYRPAPRVLHGDLRGGNAAYLSEGTPVIVDPASHLGDRKANLAMTELLAASAPDSTQPTASRAAPEPQLRHPQEPAKPLPHPQPLQPVRARLRRSGAVHGEAAAGRGRRVNGRPTHTVLSAYQTTISSAAADLRAASSARRSDTFRP